MEFLCLEILMHQIAKIFILKFLKKLKCPQHHTDTPTMTTHRPLRYSTHHPPALTPLLNHPPCEPVGIGLSVFVS